MFIVNISSVLSFYITIKPAWEIIIILRSCDLVFYFYFFLMFLQLALAGAPQSSDIFVFTDAAAKDLELKSTVQVMIERTKSTVNACKSLLHNCS